MTFSIYLLLILVIVLSMDAFAAGFSYGMEGVRVPFPSVFMIAFLSGSMLTVSLLAGNLLLGLIPRFLTKGISFSILFVLALYKFYDWKQNLPASPRKKAEPPQGGTGLTTREISKKVNKADTSVLSCKEAVFLALALSVDNISAGLCTGTVSLPFIILLLFTIVVHFFSIRFGLFMGRLLCAKCSHSFAWLGAAILMALAFFRLL